MLLVVLRWRNLVLDVQADHNPRVAGSTLKVPALLGALHTCRSSWHVDSSLPLHVGPITIMSGTASSDANECAQWTHSYIQPVRVNQYICHAPLNVLSDLSLLRQATDVTFLTLSSVDLAKAELIVHCADWMFTWNCRHSPLSGSNDLERWAGAATESIVSAYRSVPQLIMAAHLILALTPSGHVCGSCIGPLLPIMLLIGRSPRTRPWKTGKET